jgi:ABC-type proline/glycine betaine transport system permease subunit
MTDESQPHMGRLFGLIALYTLLGAPLVAFLWETLNRLMAGHFDLVRIGISVPVFALFLLLLRFMARAAQRITA